MTLRATVQVFKIPAKPGVHDACVETRVDVACDEIDWSLTQGQYLAIVAMMQQNFVEQQFVVEDMFPLQPLRQVPRKCFWSILHINTHQY